MEKDTNRLDYLLGRYLQGEIDAKEMSELGELVSTLESTELFEAVDRVSSRYGHDGDVPRPSEVTYKNILLDPRVLAEPPRVGYTKPVRRIILRWTAGIAALFVAGFLLFLGLHQSNENGETMIADHPVDADRIVPGEEKATLTLADGRTINLDDLAAGNITEELGIRISKTADGQLFYESVAGQDLSEVAYNQIATPKGGEYRVILPDGTKVWLNAASSLVYPTRFVGDTRTVELVGEAYFEVVPVVSDGSPAKRQPFIVQTPMQRVEVLGTHFNINAYPDVSNEKTTLLEGRVMVSAAVDGGSETSKVLRPNDQATVQLSGRSDISISQVDPMHVIAWKEGYFAFADEHITEVMLTLSRWYDIEVVYEGDVADMHFGGTISRFEEFDKLLETIALTGAVTFEISGRRVTVMT